MSKYRTHTGWNNWNRELASHDYRELFNTQPKRWIREVWRLWACFKVANYVNRDFFRQDLLLCLRLARKSLEDFPHQPALRRLLDTVRI